jgi:hypothetical protein
MSDLTRVESEPHEVARDETPMRVLNAEELREVTGGGGSPSGDPEINNGGGGDA